MGLLIAESLKDKSFDKVQPEAAHSTEKWEKFWFEGSYFRTLGTEYGTQYPVYTTRTFPE